MSTKIFNKNIGLILGLIILAEIISFLGYYFQLINFVTFFVIILVALILSLYKLEYGLYILITELLIGSFGYLFYFENASFKISIRIALWLIIMSVWLAGAIIKFIKTQKLELDFLRSAYFYYFLVLFISIGWGLLNGWLKSNPLSNLFFDFNNWLYFLLIFPLYSFLQADENLKTIKQIFFVSIAWLSLKTIILAYIFSHSFNYFILDLYRWVRLSGAGEITQVVPGFSRVFMQSHIFVLIGFFVLLFYLLRDLVVIARSAFSPGLDPGDAAISSQAEKPEIASLSRAIARDQRFPSVARNDRVNKLLTLYFILLTFFLSAIILSFSRSFWLGLAAGGLFVWLIAIFKLKIKLKQFIAFNSLVLSVIVLSLTLTAVVVKFPYPAPAGGFDAASLLEDRATALTGEAGASSRWQLLPPLWGKITTAPILGRGYGATVTYKSSDPRVLANNPLGEYTTYAFEWGWLDIWLKLGLFGLLAYLALFAKLIFTGLKNNSYLALSLTAGLIVLAAVNITSPYVNHPLGIGYLIVAALTIERLSLWGAPATKQSHVQLI